MNDYNKAIKKGYWKHELKYCIEITNEWLGNKNNKQNIIIKHNIGDTFKYKGKEYYIDGHDVVIEYNNNEVNFAIWLSSIINKRIELFPRFNIPENFKTADYKIGKEYFDYKHTLGKSNQLIYHNVVKNKKQSLNYIINITNINLNKEDIMYQIDDTFRRVKYIRIIAIKSKYGFKVFKKKK